MDAGASPSCMDGRQNTFSFWGLQNKPAPEHSASMLRHSKLQTELRGWKAPWAGVGSAGVEETNGPACSSELLRVRDSTATT